MPSDKWDAVFLCFPPGSQQAHLRKSHFLSIPLAGSGWVLLGSVVTAGILTPEHLGAVFTFGRGNFRKAVSFERARDELKWCSHA